MDRMPIYQKSIYQEDYVVVGGGIAGLRTALEIKQLHKQYDWPKPTITIIDNERELKLALSSGNGGSLRADESCVIDLTVPINPLDRWRSRNFLRPREEAYLDGQEKYKISHDVERDNELMLQLGLVAMQGWQDFAKEHPEIAARAGYRPAVGGTGAEKPVIFFGPGADEGSEKLVRNYSNTASPAQKITRTQLLGIVPQLEHFVHSAQAEQSYVMQPGGAINPKILVEEIKKELEDELGENFIRITDSAAAGLQYGGNDAENVNGIVLEDNRIIGSHTSKYIITSGANHTLGEKLGIKIPAAMGYAGSTITVPIAAQLADKYRDMIPLVLNTSYGAPVISILKDPATGDLSIRLGGLKVFVGEDVPTLNDQHIKNLVDKQITLLATFFPDIMAKALGKDVLASGIDDNDRGSVNAWTGARPVAFDTRPTIGRPERLDGKGGKLKNLLFVGHLSSCGISFSGIMGKISAQLLTGADENEVEISGLSRDLSREVMQMCSPSRNGPELPKSLNVAAK